MRWDRFFDDLEDQFDSEREAERASLDGEAERLRISRLTLRERLRVLGGGDGDPATLSFDLADGSVMAAAVTAVGADWIALQVTGARAGTTLVPLGAVMGIGSPQSDLVRSAMPASASHAGLSARMSFGFVLRDLVRRRSGVAVHLVSGRVLTGTIDRAGADHLDLAVHEPDAPRRAAEVTGYRTIPFAAIAWVGIDAGSV